MKKLIKVLYGIILFIVLIGAPLIGRFGADLFDFSSIDPDQAFMWISVHHVIQTIVVILLVFILIKLVPIKFHLGFGNKKAGIKYVKMFMLFFTIYAVVVFGITYVMGNFVSFQYPLNARNIFGYLGFQLFLSGPSEEFIFRMFAITTFAFFISNKRIDRHLSHANLFALVVFGLAHVSISFAPFDLTYSIGQVFFAMGLGFFYGHCYEKTESVIYPMIMHSFSNVLMIGITVILSFI